MGGLEGFSITPRKRSTVVDPIQIFDSLTLRGTIKDIWGSQKDALNVRMKHWQRYERTMNQPTFGQNLEGQRLLLTQESPAHQHQSQDPRHCGSPDFLKNVATKSMHS